MKRIFWTVGMSLVGLCFGWYSQGYPLNFRELAISTIWAGSIGFGFGSIFSQHRQGMRLVIYWAATLALVGLFFGPLLPTRSFIVGQALGGAMGAFVGVLAGTLQLKLAHRKSQAPSASVAG